MVGVVVATHGEMAPGLKDAVRLIMGPQEKFEVVSLFEGMDLEEFTANVFNTVKSVNDEGVVIFVDMFGATPFNTVAKLKRELEEENIKSSLITGVNLPMILETLAMRESSDFSALTEGITDAGKESIELIPVSGTEE